MTNLTRRNALRLTAGIAALPLTAALAKANGHATAHTVVIKGMKFKPANIEIKVGDSITWINEDRMGHTATELNGAFDTGTLGQGESATLTFGGKSMFKYRCTPHANMRGTITVS